MNFFIDKEKWFKLTVQAINKAKQKFGNAKVGKDRRILIEYSAPNTNKPQHLGHLRNNFIGMAMANFYFATGYDVVKINLINDRGIHICKSMLAYDNWGENKTPESTKTKGDHFVGKYYALFEKMAIKNPELLDQAQEILEKWEAGDQRIILLWQKMNKWALDGIKETYQRIGVSFDKWYFESDIYKLGRQTILKALKKGLCYQREDKAIEIDLIKDNLDKKVLIRPNQTTVYLTQDIALAQKKYKDFTPHKSIYVVASEQDYYFKVLFRVLEIFGFKWAQDCEHLSYGMVFLPEGKMKSRQGIVIDADDIIDKMNQLAKTEVLKRNPDITPIDVSKRADKIALAALKFFFLKFSPKHSVNFNPVESISFEGDTGPYVLYTYARIKSIIRKDKPADEEIMKKIDYSLLKNKQEIELLKLLSLFEDTIAKARQEHNTGILANYLLKISQKFNEFYHQHKVLKAGFEVKKARIELILAVAHVIKKGLILLGIDTLEKM